MPVLGPDIRYSQRINTVMNFTHAYSHTNLQLDQLANVACLSRYHFVRVFHQQVGEAPVSFLKRTRIERAANMLVNAPDLPVMRIATQCGFSSSELFSRNFNNRFGHCPTEFRTAHLNGVEDNEARDRHEFEALPTARLDLENDFHDATKRISIVNLAPTRVAYVRSIGGYGACSNIELAENLIEDWAKSKAMKKDELKFIGVSWDFPSITPDNKCRYDACIVFPDDIDSHSGISLQIIPGGWYATASFAYQTGSDLLALWRWFSLTLGNSARFKGLRTGLASGPWFERFSKNDEKGEYRVQLYTLLNARMRY